MRTAPREARREEQEGIDASVDRNYARDGLYGAFSLRTLAARRAQRGRASATQAHAEGPGSGTPTTVSLGDSFISGEAGRWAGNTDESSSKTDALGSSAYYDNATNTGELIEGCHRSKSAEVYVGGGVNGENLACSGAKTSSFTD